MINFSDKETDWYKNHPRSGNWRQFCKIRVKLHNYYKEMEL